MQAQILVDRFLRSKFSTHLNVYEKMLLVILASYCGNKSACFPSYLSLKRDCSMSIDSIKRNIKTLESKELIKVARCSGRNNLYTLQIPSADSTGCSQHPDANSTDLPELSAPSPSAHSTPNNISNNKRKSTSIVSHKKHKNKRTAFPDGMTIIEAHRELAQELGINAEEEFIFFKEHHIAKGSLFAYWNTAFNTWLRKAKKFTQEKSPSPTTNIMAEVGHE